MDKQDYIDNLKTIELRPGRVKIKEHEPVILCEQEDAADMKLHDTIIEWFAKNPYPEDEEVHNLASEMGMEHDEFERHIYGVLSSILSEGRSKGKTEGYDPEQLAMGIKVEMEHTTHPTVAKKIACDHLEEIPDYYTRLAKMEKEAGVDHEKE